MHVSDGLLAIHVMLSMTDIVDGVLAEDDIDMDGYVTYLEFSLAKRREEIKERQAAQKFQASHNHL